MQNIIQFSHQNMPYKNVNNIDNCVFCVCVHAVVYVCAHACIFVFVSKCLSESEQYNIGNKQ